MIAFMDQREIPFAERRFRNAKFRRGIFLLPALFTSANLLCGYYAVVAALNGNVSDFDHAARAIGLAILFDSQTAALPASPAPIQNLAYSSIRSPTSSASALLRPFLLTLGVSTAFPSARQSTLNNSVSSAGFFALSS